MNNYVRVTQIVTVEKDKSKAFRMQYRTSSKKLIKIMQEQGVIDNREACELRLTGRMTRDTIETIITEISEEEFKNAQTVSGEVSK